MKNLGTIVCADCNATAAKTGPHQLFCVDCSSKRHRARQLRWSRQHPVSNTPERMEATRKRNSRRAEARSQHVLEQRGHGSPAWLPSDLGRDLTWTVTIGVPFSYALSKNATWRSIPLPGGHVQMRQKAADAREMVRARLMAAMAERTPAVDAKVYIDIFVQKPDHRGDAINVIDTVCDGVKDALGVDDRWFCLRGVDWEVSKSEPIMWIRVGQAESEPQRVCSICGQIRSVASFGKAKRECPDCRKAVRRRQRALGDPTA